MRRENILRDGLKTQSLEANRIKFWFVAASGFKNPFDVSRCQKGRMDDVSGIRANNWESFCVLPSNCMSPYLRKAIAAPCNFVKDERLQERKYKRKVLPSLHLSSRKNDALATPRAFVLGHIWLIFLSPRGKRIQCQSRVLGFEEFCVHVMVVFGQPGISLEIDAQGYKNATFGSAERG